MNKPNIRRCSPEQLQAYRERLWRAKPTVSNLCTLGRIDRRIEELRKAHDGKTEEPDRLQGSEHAGG